MASRRLKTRHVERIWGRRDLGGPFAAPGPDSGPIGEIWFEDEDEAAPELLVKYLFTAERLSIQVHPDDAAARAAGHARGKDEAWFVLSAEPGAVIGLGLRETVAPGVLRAAALDGSIEALIDWRPVAAGDAFYSPAGTVHAIGAGLSLIEIQQNLDLTYRLYDYGRPRPLHLDEALAVATPGPWSAPFAPAGRGTGRQILAAGGAFVVERWTGPGAAEAGEGGITIVPIASGGTLDGEALAAGAAWAVEGRATVAGAGIDLLAAYPGSEIRDAAFRPA